MRERKGEGKRYGDREGRGRETDNHTDRQIKKQREETVRKRDRKIKREREEKRERSRERVEKVRERKEESKIKTFNEKLPARRQNR